MTHRVGPDNLPPGPPHRLSIVLSAGTTIFSAVVFTGQFEDNLATIASLGYDGVELTIRDPALIDGEALMAILRQHRLEVPAIGTGQAWSEDHLSLTDPEPAVRRAAVERLQSHVPLAARCGAIVIAGLLRGTVPPGAARTQATAWLVEGLRECCAVGAASGVRLALEPINRYETALINTVADGLDLIERVGADNLGLLLDTFHMNIEEPSIEASIRSAGDRIFHFHVADSNRRHPGGGHLDFRALLETLFDTGYRGFVSGEFMPVPDANTAARNAIEHLRMVLHR